MSSVEQLAGRAGEASVSRTLPRVARLAVELLEGLEGGAVELGLPDGSSLRLGHGPLVAHWQVRDLATFDAALARGDIGLAEAWMDGLWECDDLAALLGLLARNRARLGRTMYGKWLRIASYRMWHWLRANTRRGSRRNIMAHYDLGNAFYRLWLDPGMTYSSALFAAPDEPLEEAQLRKYRRILYQLGAQPGDEILEIGCGWGGFAEVAAREFGCRVHGLTLSPAQLEWAEQRARDGGYADAVRFELRDYRDSAGQYDHIVSIEMIEAVGERYWPAYFDTLKARLKPGGRCVVQAITIGDSLFERYRRSPDFIQRYIFPGGMLPSPARIDAQAKASGLCIEDDFGFGADYAHTLRRWYANFAAARGEVRQQGFDERFVRTWRFYLAYCEAGFEVGDIDVRHYTLTHA